MTLCEKEPQMHASNRAGAVSPLACPSTEPGAGLTVADLTVEAVKADGASYKLLDGVGLSVKRGQVLGLVGESGSGKSMLAKSVMGLLPNNVRITQGRIEIAGANVSDLNRQKVNYLGRRVAMIFQDPMSSLNPVLRVGQQLVEAIRIHQDLSAGAASALAHKLLRGVGIADVERGFRAYPHEFSGGMRQRVMIAMAVANRPDVLIADEPTTALDVTVQNQILRLLRDLASKESNSVVLITHNMGVVAAACDYVAVMYSGRVVEQGPVDEIFAAPAHPYTVSLLKSVPRLDVPKQRILPSIPGQAPDPAVDSKGCRFAPRCAAAQPTCWNEAPDIKAVGREHDVRCWF